MYNTVSILLEPQGTILSVSFLIVLYLHKVPYCQNFSEPKGTILSEISLSHKVPYYQYPIWATTYKTVSILSEPQPTKLSVSSEPQCTILSVSPLSHKVPYYQKSLWATIYHTISILLEPQGTILSVSSLIHKVPNYQYPLWATRYHTVSLLSLSSKASYCQSTFT